MISDIAAPRRWPPLLRPGDTVAAVAPSGAPTRATVQHGCELLASWGLEVEMLPAAFDGHRSGFLAAEDDRRVADLNAALADDRYAGVVCIRGGYGSQRLLDHLDVTPLLERPKAFWGYSDITALHVALGQRAGMVTYHAPNLEWNRDRLDESSAASLRAALMGGPASVLHGEALHPGRVRAPMVGGNLTLLSTLCGTPDTPDARGAILLCEDIGEVPFRMDRAITHLRRAGVLDGVVGLVFADFHGSRSTPGQATSRDVAAAHAEVLGVPALWGLPLGHGPNQRAVALGAEALLDADTGLLALPSR